MSSTGMHTVFNERKDPLKSRMRIPLDIMKQLGFTVRSKRFEDNLTKQYKNTYPLRTTKTEAHLRYLSEQSRIIGKAFNDLLIDELLNGNEVVMPGGEYSFTLFKAYYTNSQRARETNGQKILLMMRLKTVKTGLRFLKKQGYMISYIHGYPSKGMRRRIKKKLDEGVKYPSKVLPYLEKEL